MVSPVRCIPFFQDHCSSYPTSHIPAMALLCPKCFNPIKNRQHLVVIDLPVQRSSGVSSVVNHHGSCQLTSVETHNDRRY